MAEFLDVYDANKKHVGRADRAVVHAFGLWHKTVHCWIVWDGKLVFQLRSARRTDNPGKLYTSASGHLSAGESLTGAAAREIKEELGIAANPKQFDMVTWTADIVKTDGTMFYDRVFATTFWAEYIGGLSDFKFADGEVDGVVAFDIGEFADWSHKAAGAIRGLSWDGQRVKEAEFTAADFVLVGAEVTIYEKYGRPAEMIKEIMGNRGS